MPNEIKLLMNTTRSQNNKQLSFFLCCIMLCAMPLVTKANEVLSPMTQSIMQSSTPDYIAQAKAGVKKYYPEYESHFKNIFLEIKRLWWYEEYLINKEIEKNLVLSWDLLSNEKDIVTTILISLENITWNENFKNKKWISEDDDIWEIAKDIKDGFFKNYLKQRKYIENFQNDIKDINSKIWKVWQNEIWNEYISLSEKYMPLLKDFLLNYGFLHESKETQEWIENYIEALSMINRPPSQSGKQYIDAYNKIKKQ